MKKEELKDFITEVDESKLNFLGRFFHIAIPIAILYFETLFVTNLPGLPKDNVFPGILFVWTFVNSVFFFIFPTLAIFPKILKYIFTGDFSFHFNYYFNTGG